MRIISLFAAITLLFFTGCAHHKSYQTVTKATMLNHIALNVTNLERSAKFYSEVLQLDTMPNPFNDGLHTWFGLPGGAQLHLIQHRDIPAQVKGTHICFSVQDIQKSVNMLNALNMNWEDWPGKAKTITKRPDGVQQVYFKDPDGYWIEVNDDQSAYKPR